MRSIAHMRMRDERRSEKEYSRICGLFLDTKPFFRHFDTFFDCGLQIAAESELFRIADAGRFCAAMKKSRNAR